MSMDVLYLGQKEPPGILILPVSESTTESVHGGASVSFTVESLGGGTTHSKSESSVSVTAERSVAALRTGTKPSQAKPSFECA